MSCPTCDHTMHGIPPLQWCCRCGTIKTDGNTYVPALVERARKMVADSPSLQQIAWMAGVMDALYLPEDRGKGTME